MEEIHPHKMIFLISYYKMNQRKFNSWIKELAIGIPVNVTTTTDKTITVSYNNNYRVIKSKTLKTSLFLTNMNRFETTCVHSGEWIKIKNSPYQIANCDFVDYVTKGKVSCENLLIFNTNNRQIFDNITKISRTIRNWFVLYCEKAYKYREPIYVFPDYYGTLKVLTESEVQKSFAFLLDFKTGKIFKERGMVSDTIVYRTPGFPDDIAEHMIIHETMRQFDESYYSKQMLTNNEKKHFSDDSKNLHVILKIAIDQYCVLLEKYI